MQSTYDFDHLSGPRSGPTSAASGAHAVVKEEAKQKPQSTIQQSLGSQAFFDDAPLPETEPTLGSRVFFNGFSDYPPLEEPALYNELNPGNGLSLYEPEPHPEPMRSATKLTKKRKSQAWDSKPLENRRKSHNFNQSKALDIRRKTMYCSSEKPHLSHNLSKSFVEESPRFENSSFYASGFSNPNNRLNRGGDNSEPSTNPSNFFSSGLGSNHHSPNHSQGQGEGVQIREPTDYMYEEGVFPMEPPSSDLANLFIGPEKEGIQAVRKILLKRRKSEDWDSRPLEVPPGPGQAMDAESERKARFFDYLEKCKQEGITPGGGPQGLNPGGANGFAQAHPSAFAPHINGSGRPSGYRQMSVPGSTMSFSQNILNSNRGVASGARVDKPQVAFDFGEDSKQRRTKWTSEEVHTLWQGIMLHGNNWSIIKDSLPSRTYYQIKDKGRRILYNQGWKTGRTKKDAGGASDDAKIIAQGILNQR